MWWKIGALVLAALVLIVLLAAPITFDVTVELPPPQAVGAAPQPVTDHDVTRETAAARLSPQGRLIVAACLALVCWLIWREVRRR